MDEREHSAYVHKDAPFSDNERTPDQTNRAPRSFAAAVALFVAEQLAGGLAAAFGQSNAQAALSVTSQCSDQPSSDPAVLSPSASSFVQ